MVSIMNAPSFSFDDVEASLNASLNEIENGKQLPINSNEHRHSNVYTKMKRAHFDYVSV